MTTLVGMLERRRCGLARTAVDRLRTAFLRNLGTQVATKARVRARWVVACPWCLAAGHRLQIAYGVNISFITYHEHRLEAGRQIGR